MRRLVASLPLWSFSFLPRYLTPEFLLIKNNQNNSSKFLVRLNVNLDLEFWSCWKEALGKPFKTWHRQELPHKDSNRKFNKLWEGYKWTTAYTASGNVKQGSYNGNQNVRSSNNLNLSYNPAIPLLKTTVKTDQHSVETLNTHAACPASQEQDKSKPGCPSVNRCINGKVAWSWRDVLRAKINCWFSRGLGSCWFQVFVFSALTLL